MLSPSRKARRPLRLGPGRAFGKLWVTSMLAGRCKRPTSSRGRQVVTNASVLVERREEYDLIVSHLVEAGMLEREVPGTG